MGSRMYRRRRRRFKGEGRTAMAIPQPRLTSRQKQLCRLLLDGHTTSKELGIEMRVREQVIKNMMGDIFDFTGMGNRVELALFLVRHRELIDE
jgi:DNA-binding NarL/FixJ family response regulator